MTNNGQIKSAGDKRFCATIARDQAVIRVRRMRVAGNEPVIIALASTGQASETRSGNLCISDDAFDRGSIQMLGAAKAVTFVLTNDRAALKPFYSDVLGLRQVSEDQFGTAYDLGGGATLRLTSIAGHVPGPHTVLGWVVADIAATIDLLRTKGVAMCIYDGFGQDARGIWSNPEDGTKIAWFLDPEGNNLSLIQF